MKFTLTFPAWIFYFVYLVVRMIFLSVIMINYYLLFIANFVFWIFAMIRNFFLDYIYIPIWSLFSWIKTFMWNLMVWIIMWPYKIMELLFRFYFAIQKLILSLLWGIIYPIIQFFMWLMAYIPNLIWTFIIQPILWAVFFVFGWIIFIVMYIPNLLWGYVQMLFALIFRPLDMICVSLWGIIDGLLDTILALVGPPTWEPAWPFIEPAGMLLYAASNIE